MGFYYIRRRRRDADVVANRRLPRSDFSSFRRPLPFSISSGIPVRSSLQDFEDRREFHPEGSFAPAGVFERSGRRLVVGDQRRSKVVGSEAYPSSRVAFQTPSSVLVCVRRRQRQEVLHALGKTGKVGQTKPHYNFYSQVSCRR